MLAAEVGPVDGDPVDRDQGAIDDHVQPPGRRRHHPLQARCGGGQQVDDFTDVAEHGGDADGKPAGQPGVGIPAAQMRKYQQGLPARIQPPPTRPEGGPVDADLFGQPGQSVRGQRQTARIFKHRGSLGGDMDRG